MTQTNPIELNSSDTLASNSSDHTHIVFAFDDTKLIGELFGQFDQNLALIEQRLGVDAIAKGNQVEIKGSKLECENARKVLENLYGRLQLGHEIQTADVEGVIRLTTGAESQQSNQTFKATARQSFAQIATRRKTIIARTPNQDAYIRAIERSDLTFGLGPAGTGKTFIAVAYAASMLESGEVNRIILSRPAVEAGERLGFLPGDMREKIDPYLRPLFDGLFEMMPTDKVERGLQSGSIEIAPLAFMRGRTLSNALIILDEAQNTSAMQMKMFLTRLGENSKMIVTGDPSQIDLPAGQKSGLNEALRILNNVEGIAKISFHDTDVIRHGLVAKIVQAYDNSKPQGAVDSSDK